MAGNDPDNLYPGLEGCLQPLAEPLPSPQPGDWLTEHKEDGQTFRQYQAALPVRRGATLTTIYLCVLGEFDAAQQRILDRTGAYLALFFDAPVRVHRHVATTEIPSHAKRKHPQWGDRQLLTRYLLEDILEATRPDDALAYLALTAKDLWPGDGWNFVFGEAKLRERVGVWSIYRNGYPGKSDAAERLCLRRTLLVAAHETGHILTMQHCTAHRCLMNGMNHQDERDRAPLYPCPVCLRKLIWNLQVEPAAYLRRLAAFSQDHGLADAAWFARAAELVASASTPAAGESAGTLPRRSR
jgi:archaemetzincin